MAEIARGFVESHDGNIENLTLTIPNGGGCHRKCYQYFTDSTKQRRAVLAKQKRKAASTPTGKQNIQGIIGLLLMFCSFVYQNCINATRDISDMCV